MFSKRLYRLYAPDSLFGHLDSFKQANFYVDIRDDGIHRPKNEAGLKDVLDFLLTFGTERADSFLSWHITVRRSGDYLKLALASMEAKNWTTTFDVDEIKADILYQASSMSASVVPDYGSFIDFMEHYKKRPSKNYLEKALLELADELRDRAMAAPDLPLFHARLAYLR